jgi:hypothetical protein
MAQPTDAEIIRSAGQVASRQDLRGEIVGYRKAQRQQLCYEVFGVEAALHHCPLVVGPERDIVAGMVLWCWD